MRKRFFECMVAIVILSFLLPFSASAYGGYFVVRGLNGYHSALCENLKDYNIEQVTWYESLESVKRTGLSQASCCEDGTDYVDDGASIWNSSNKKIDNIFEIERIQGVLDGYELGLEDGYSKGYSSGHTDGLNEGVESGYTDGYDQGYKKGLDELDPMSALLGILGILFVFVATGMMVSHDKNVKAWVAEKETEQILFERNMKEKETAMMNDMSQKIDDKYRCIRTEVNTERAAIEQLDKQISRIIKETKQKHPELSRQIADAQYYLDMRSYDRLLNQKHPALKAAEEVKKIANEKRQLTKENRQLQYQLDFYEKLFPWLEEFKEVPSDEAVAYAMGAYGTEYDAIKKWLSPEEYEKLSNCDKFQLALDRWKNRHKCDWDIGIEYERYIGYKLECAGYKVSYIGATLGVNDMGRDLIATKNGQTLIIQCKRWSKDKTIHEKHIFQLYGSSVVYATELPEVSCKAVFITTTALSDVARKCAEYCGISVVEHCPFGEYPLIKCNTNKDGEKIYHLPFDQQYDKIVISKNKRSFYAWTTEEAERLGFRRAYRWRPSKS